MSRVDFFVCLNTTCFSASCGRKISHLSQIDRNALILVRASPFFSRSVYPNMYTKAGFRNIWVLVHTNSYFWAKLSLAKSRFSYCISYARVAVSYRI